VLPQWMVAMSLLWFGAIILGLATVVCAIIGVCKQARRGFAISALVISGGLLLMNCAGLLMGGL